MAVQQTYNFKPAIHGDTWSGVTMNLVVNGSPKDITGAVIKMSLVASPQASPVKTFSTVTGEIVITNAALGEFTFQPFICNIDPGQYNYDLQIDFLDGTIKTYVKGLYTVIADITQ